MSSPALAEPVAIAEDFHWVNLDDEPVAAIYPSIEEMRSSPIRLTGAKAAKFYASKRTREPRSARPLSLDE